MKRIFKTQERFQENLVREELTVYARRLDRLRENDQIAQFCDVRSSALAFLCGLYFCGTVDDRQYRKLVDIFLQS